MKRESILETRYPDHDTRPCYCSSKGLTVRTESSTHETPTPFVIEIQWIRTGRVIP